MKNQTTMCIIIRCTALAIIAIMSARQTLSHQSKKLEP